MTSSSTRWPPRAWPTSRFPLGGFSPLQSSALSAVATRHGASPMAVALAWLLQAVGPLGLRRQAERGASRLDALLGAADPLGHRRRRHQERPGDLGGREPRHRPQRQRQLRRRRQRQVTAQERQREGVVAQRPSRAGGLDRALLLPAAAGLLGAEVVGDAAAGDRQEPGLRAAGPTPRRATGWTRPGEPS
jgi:hypothetical protein